MADVSQRFILLMLLIGILTLVGMLVIMFLLIAWRRNLQRQIRQARGEDDSDAPPTEKTDIWSAAGRRMEDPKKNEDEQNGEPDNDA